jgi:hypothetical protein
MDKLNSIFELRQILYDLERDIGIEELTQTEKNVLFAASKLTRAPGDIVLSEQIRDHHLMESVPHATFHRAIRHLLQLGILKHAKGTKTKQYTVRCDLLENKATS